MSKTKIIHNLAEFGIITFGAALAAAAIFFFMLPSNVAVGSASALAMVLANFIPLPVFVINLAINVFLLLIGFLLIGPEFGAKTVYTSTMVPVFMGIYEFFFPHFKSLTEDPLLDVLCYIIVVGMAMAILFSKNASSGGLDIVGKVINKYFRVELGKAIAMAGMCVAASSVFVSDIKSVVLSIFGTYLSGIILDHFIFGFNIKKRVCFISNKEKEIVEFILKNLHSGATYYEATGAYDDKTRREVITILTKNEYSKLMAFIAKTDPDAFVTVYTVNEVLYKPKNIA